MKQRILLALSLVAVSVALWAVVIGCATAPYTGRSQLMLLSDDKATAMGADAAQQIKQEEPVVTSGPTYERIQRIGHDIAAVTDQPDLEWDFNYIDKDTINAFALPGGKIFFYEGIVELAGENDDMLAVVMGHEIAHVIVRHGAERVSMSMAAQVGGQVVSAATQSQTYSQIYGIATQMGLLLPYSRTQESEADRVGLILMAKAGYDPRLAVDFWRRMNEAGGERPPEFLSTHPAPESRIEEIKQFLPEAMQHYRKG
jgi:predicted Zn-dependent protease